MTKLLHAATASLLILAIAVPLLAQQRKSPHESTSIEVAGHKITITYGRPSMHGRKIMGGLVPDDKVWRTGADEATILETDADLELNGLKLPKGTYALFTIPNPKSWTLIVNKTAKQWGAFDYKEADDLGRTKMQVSKSASPVEQFTITLTPAGSDGATLKMEWENTVASVPVKVVQ